MKRKLKLAYEVVEFNVWRGRSRAGRLAAVRCYEGDEWWPAHQAPDECYEPEQPEQPKPGFEVGRYWCTRSAGVIRIASLLARYHVGVQWDDGSVGHLRIDQLTTPWLPAEGDRVRVDGRSATVGQVGKGWGIVERFSGDAVVVVSAPGFMWGGEEKHGTFSMSATAIHPASFPAEKAKPGSLEWKLSGENGGYGAISVLNDEGTMFWYRIDPVGEKRTITASSPELLAGVKNRVWPSLSDAQAACQAIEDGIIAEAAKPKSRLKEWLEVYYPRPVSDVPEDQAVQACLLKFKGVRPEVLKEYGLRKSNPGGSIVGDDGGFRFSSDECSLCVVHRNSCKKCELETHGHGHCMGANSPYEAWRRTGDPEPMISALQSILAKQAKPGIAPPERVPDGYEWPGEKRPPMDGEWYIDSMSYNAVLSHFDGIEACRYILRKIEIAPPADGPWSKTCRWDGKEERYPKRGESYTNSGVGWHVAKAGIDFDSIKCFILIPLTTAEVQARDAEALQRDAEKWWDECGGMTPNPIDHLTGFYKYMQARDDSTKGN